MPTDWERKLRGEGYRMTGARRSVVRVLQRSARALSAGDLHERARKQHPRLGLVTVYRTLEVLERLGLVRRIHGDGSCHAFTAASPGHRHVITCEECARTTEFDGDDVCLLTEGVEEKTGYRISGHWLQLTGLCPSCRGAGD